MLSLFSRTRRGGLLCAATLSLLAANQSHAADYLNRRVDSVLDELRAQGLIFIYNTEVVPADLRIVAEPKARTGMTLATEILAGHSLALSPVAPGIFAVVRLGKSEAKIEDATPADAPVDAPTATFEEIVVLSSRYTLATSAGPSQLSLTQEQVKNMPRLADETLRALQRLPGTSTNGFSSSSSVRGGEPNETAIVLDGLRLYEPFHLKNFLSPVSLLDSRLIQSMEFYSGGYPVLYGDRMSALIEATSIRPQARYFEAGLTLFHMNALAAGDFAQGKARMLISARRSNAGFLSRYSESDIGEPNYSDGFMRLEYQFSDATRASWQTLLSGDRIDAIKDGGDQRSRAEYQSAYTWATLQHDWSTRAGSRLIASYTDVTNKRNGSIIDPGARQVSVTDNRSFHVIGLRLDNTLETNGIGRGGDHAAHRYGVESRRLWAHYQYASEVHFAAGYPFPASSAYDLLRTAAPQPAGYETSAYWDSRANINDRFSAHLGLRFDTQTYDSSADAEQWSPRLGVLYKLTDKTDLRASWGRFYQSQGINELQVEDGIGEFNPAQRAHHTIISLNHAFHFGVDMRIEAYRKDYRRLNPRFENTLDQLVLLPETEFDRVLVQPTAGRSEGVELLLQMRPHGAWSGWLSYTLARANDTVAGSNVARTWDQRHAVNLGIAWARGPWSVTVTDTYHSGWPTTALNVVPNPSGPSSEVRFGPRNAERLDDYNSFDFRVARTFVLGRGALDVYVEASNVFSRANACCVNYSIEPATDGSVYVTSRVNSWLPLVPSAGVLWRY